MKFLHLLNVISHYNVIIFSYFDLIGINPEQYEDKIRKSWVWTELQKTRNIRPAFDTRLGMYGGLIYTGTAWYLTQGHEPWTFHAHPKGGNSTVPSRHINANDLSYVITC